MILWTHPENLQESGDAFAMVRVVPYSVHQAVERQAAIAAALDERIGELEIERSMLMGWRIEAERLLKLWMYRPLHHHIPEGATLFTETRDFLRTAEGKSDV